VRVLTWHVHGSYLRYLAHAPHEFLLPTKAGGPEGYGGRAGNAHWPVNLQDVPAEAVRDLDVDLVLYQSRRNWEVDGPEILSEAQRRGPRAFVEHDPPRETPTDTRHVVDDDRVLLVHVTPFNALMWDSGSTPTRVIDHGVTVPDGVRWTGELDRGLTVVNGLASRGRRLGSDVFERMRGSGVALDLVGMQSEALGGLGEVPAAELPAVAARYRVLFNPIRYTSLGLAVCEAMMLGMPVVALATTEYATAIENGVSGWVDTDVEVLADHLRRLLADPDEARVLGEGARRRALDRFGIERFARDWDAVFHEVAG
jgi:hypothetical protein